jgi:hypothetical protein
MEKLLFENTIYSCPVVWMSYMQNTTEDSTKGTDTTKREYRDEAARRGS